jgi:alpha-L-fucosidase
MKLVEKSRYESAVARTRDRRMKWWREARYGMFVHWGLYSLIGRNEWVHAIEAIPMEEYEKLIAKFRPKKNPANEWAKLAKVSGMKYMVLTTKHHEGFCLWDTKTTDFNAVTACGRDLVREYVDACRAQGLKVGFYFSLMDWHHPDGARCAYDPEARRRFLEDVHGQVRELMSNYGKIDILWYDVPEPFQHHEGWESLALNQMVRKLQPHIIINNRSRLEEDFSTPEEHVTAAQRDWEACMTFNATSWGWMPSAAQDAHSPRDILKMLNTACGGCGNLLLNIGPSPEGDVPEEAVVPLTTVGAWLKKNGEAVYGKLDRTNGKIGLSTTNGGFSQKGKKLYFWCRCWPGRDITIGGFQTKLKSATFLDGGRKIDYEQKDNRIILKNMPLNSPDQVAGYAVIVLEFVRPPRHINAVVTPALSVGRG